jgi:hypothetical protein
MSASKKAMQGGLASLKEMAEILKAPKTTLNDWEKTKPIIFEALVIGALALKKRKVDA